MRQYRDATEQMQQLFKNSYYHRYAGKLALQNWLRPIQVTVDKAPLLSAPAFDHFRKKKTFWSLKAWYLLN